MTDASLARRDVTLLDLVDSILQRGTALSGDLVLSVADVDLVQVNLRALLASVDTVERLRSSSGGSTIRPGAVPGKEAGEPSPKAPRAPRRLPPARKAAGPSRRSRLPLAVAGHRRPATRIDTDPENVEQGLAQLVLTVIELVRQLMERQALYRMESGSLDDEQVERLGSTFQRLEERMAELTRAFGLEPDDLNLHLGPIGDLL